MTSVSTKTRKEDFVKSTLKIVTETLIPWLMILAISASITQLSDSQPICAGNFCESSADCGSSCFCNFSIRTCQSAQ